MYLELIDALRCPIPHEDTPLVASISQREDRDIVSGTLGCPVCHAEYVMERGVAIFGDEPEGGTAGVARYAEPAADLAMRCAALLDLHEPGGVVLLGGAWGTAAPDLAEMTRVLVLLVEPPAEVQLGRGLAALRAGASLPLAPGALRGIALDEMTATQPTLASAVRALKPRGRLIAPAAAAVPAGVWERARDDRHWVAEVEPGASPPIRLVRGRGAGHER